MRTAGSIIIDRPIEEVFDKTTNDVAQWSAIVVSDEVIQEREGGVGTTFRTVTEEHGRQMEFHGEVIACDPPKRQTIQMRGDLFDLWVDYQFEPVGLDQTKVTQDSDVKGKGFFRFILPVMGLVMRKQNCKALDAELQSLKRYCETGVTANQAESHA